MGRGSGVHRTHLWLPSFPPGFCSSHLDTCGNRHGMWKYHIMRKRSKPPSKYALWRQSRPLIKCPVVTSHNLGTRLLPRWRCQTIELVLNQDMKNFLLCSHSMWLIYSVHYGSVNDMLTGSNRFHRSQKDWEIFSIDHLFVARFSTSSPSVSNVFFNRYYK